MGVTPAGGHPASVDYAFSNSASQGGQQLSALERYLDPTTIPFLWEVLPPRCGARCLELGPGGGSIVRELLGRVGPDGRVVAIDRDPSRLTPAANLEVVRHDLQNGLAVAGPFALIHARLVLVHLPNRRRLVRQLVDALEPGGWLVLGEFDFGPVTVRDNHDGRDAALFTRVVDVTMELLVRQHGVDLGWAGEIEAVMTQAGLGEVRSVGHVEDWAGGHPGHDLMVACASQKHDQLLTTGLTETELQRFAELANDPLFRTSGWEFVCIRGRKQQAS